MAREQARESAGREPGDGTVEAAARRLDRAVGDLEARIIRLSMREDADLLADRAHLAAELDAARARERALESIAAEASAALGRAAAEVRAALAGSEAADGPAPSAASFEAEAFVGDDAGLLSDENPDGNLEAAPDSLEADLFAPPTTAPRTPSPLPPERSA